MKKFLIAIFCFILLTSQAFAERLPGWDNIVNFDEKDCPLWFDYFFSYGKMLHKNFDERKFNWVGSIDWGETYYVTIYRDGSIKIKEHRYNGAHDDMLDKYVKKVIKENPPPPFPEGVEEQEITLRVSLMGCSFDEIEFDYVYPEGDLSVYKKKRLFTKNRTIAPYNHYGLKFADAQKKYAENMKAYEEYKKTHKKEVEEKEAIRQAEKQFEKLDSIKEGTPEYQAEQKHFEELKKEVNRIKSLQP
ncbi:MAG: hypothetical protein PHV37_08545 [Candidatus Gastranaerophilales bacterium]|nr:hypothetical protein [Candidatus Gastranaerophilales bacterium]